MRGKEKKEKEPKIWRLLNQEEDQSASLSWRLQLDKKGYPPQKLSVGAPLCKGMRKRNKVKIKRGREPSIDCGRIRSTSLTSVF